MAGSKSEFEITLVSDISERVAGDQVSIEQGIAALEEFGAAYSETDQKARALSKGGLSVAAKAVRAEGKDKLKELQIAQQAFLDKYGSAGAKELAQRQAQKAEAAMIEQRATRESAVQAVMAARQKEADSKAASTASAAAMASAAKAEEALSKSKSARVKAEIAEAKKAAEAAKTAGAQGLKTEAEAAAKDAAEHSKLAHELAAENRERIMGHGSLEAYTGGLRASLGPMGGLLERGSAAVKAIGHGGLLGASLLATGAIVALGVGVAATAIHLTHLAITGSDAARSLRLTQDATMRALVVQRQYSAALAGGAGGVAPKMAVPDTADAMRSSIADVASEFSTSREAVAGFTEELSASERLSSTSTDAIRAMTIAKMTGSQEVVDQVKRELDAAQALGKGYTQVAVKAQKLYGDIALKQAKSITNQFAKMKAGAASIFAAAKIEPFLIGLSKITDVFREGSSAVTLLQSMLNALLDPILGRSDEAGGKLAHMFKTGIIWAAKAELAVLQLSNKLVSLIPNQALADIDLCKTALYALGAVLTVAGAAIAAVLVPAAISAATALGGMVIAGLAAAAPFLAAGAAIIAVGAAIYGLVKAVQEISDFGWGKLGSMIISGIADGIRDGAKAAIGAVIGVAGSIKDAFKSALGIHSPSAVFAVQAKQISAGVARGVQESAPMAHKAMSEMLPPGFIAGAAPQAGAGAPAEPGAAAPAVPPLPIRLPVPVPAPGAAQQRAATQGGQKHSITVHLEGPAAAGPQAKPIRDLMGELASVLERVGVEMAVSV